MIEPFYSSHGFSSLETIMICMAFMPISILISGAFVASVVWKPYWDKCQNEPAETYITPIEYRYPIDEATEGDEPSQNSYVMENTDNYGQISLKWNTEDEVFEYWGQSNIPYVVLDAVARKFVTMFCCSQIYNEFVPFSGQETDKNKDEEKDEETKNEEKETSVFATFKKYNTQNTSRASKNIVRNHFRHKGDINEMIKQCMKQPTDTIETNAKLNAYLDFSTYKKMFS